MPLATAFWARSAADHFLFLILPNSRVNRIVRRKIWWHWIWVIEGFQYIIGEHWEISHLLFEKLTYIPKFNWYKYMHINRSKYLADDNIKWKLGLRPITFPRKAFQCWSRATTSLYIQAEKNHFSSSFACGVSSYSCGNNSLWLSSHCSGGKLWGKGDRHILFTIM